MGIERRKKGILRVSEGVSEGTRNCDKEKGSVTYAARSLES